MDSLSPTNDFGTITVHDSVLMGLGTWQDLVQGKSPLDVVIALAQFLTLIALIIYVWKTWEMASATKEYSHAAGETLREMRTARSEEAAPYPVVYFDIPYGRSFVYLVAKNLGKTIAQNVIFDFDPPLRSSKPGRGDNLAFVVDGVQSLVPGQEIRTFFDTTMNLLNPRTGVPQSYQVTVSYTSLLAANRQSYVQSLDLNMFRNTGYLAEVDMQQLVEQVNSVAQEIRRTEGTIAGIARSAEAARRRRHATIGRSVIWMGRRLRFRVRR